MAKKAEAKAETPAKFDPKKSAKAAVPDNFATGTVTACPQCGNRKAIERKQVPPKGDQIPGQGSWRHNICPLCRRWWRDQYVAAVPPKAEGGG